MIDISTAVLFVARLLLRMGSWMYKQVGYEVCITVEQIAPVKPSCPRVPEVIIQPCGAPACNPCAESVTRVTTVTQPVMTGCAECATCG